MREDALRSDSVEPASYLFFRPNVLDRHFTQDHYGVFFHMRTWGRAWHPVGNIGVDVGINSEGLVVAFAGDLQKLREADQNYWSGFYTNPCGDPCDEMYQTRMLCAPPHSPGTVEMLEGARTALHGAYESRFSVPLFAEHEPSDRTRMRLSVGPIRRDSAELCSLAKDVYIWLADTLRKQALSPNTAMTKEQAKVLGTVQLLEKVLTNIDVPTAEAQELCAPLYALRVLRVGDAHSARDPVRKAREQLGLADVVSERELWFALIDALVSSFTEVAATLRS